MDYITLYDTFYKIPDSYEKAYESRFNSPFTKHFNFSIHQYNHSRSYPAFYCYTEEIALLQDQINREYLTDRQTYSSIPYSAILQFIKFNLINEVKSSNDIEGVRSTRKEIKSALENTAEKNRQSGIVNKYIMLVFNKSVPLKTCEDIKKLYEEMLLFEINEDDPGNLPDGKYFRKNSVDVITGTGKVIHRGLYPEEKIIDGMNKALDILNNPQLPYLIRIALFHYLFGYIHPFYDGNGRLDRFITAYLIAKEYGPLVGLQVSILIKQDRKKYYSLFENTESEINKGDLTPFIIQTLYFIRDAIHNINDVLTKKNTAYQTLLKQMHVKLKDCDQVTIRLYELLLQASLFSDGGITINEISKALKKTKQTIYSRLHQIPEDRLFISKNSRPFHYRLRKAWVKE